MTNDLILRLSPKFCLKPELIAAFIEVESGGSSYRGRYEPKYSYLSDVNAHAKRCMITPETETIFQKTSWGLMQVMGAVARERGFIDDLPKLTDPYFGIFYGCAHLAWLIKSYGYSGDNLISAYNAGSPRKGPLKYSNQDYVDKVNKWYAYFQTNGVHSDET